MVRCVCDRCKMRMKWYNCVSLDWCEMARQPAGGGGDNAREDGGGARGGGAGDCAAAALKRRSDASAQRGARDFREVSNERWAAVYASDPDRSRHLAAAAMATRRARPARA